MSHALAGGCRRLSRAGRRHEEAVIARGVGDAGDGLSGLRGHRHRRRLATGTRAALAPLSPTRAWVVHQDRQRKAGGGVSTTRCRWRGARSCSSGRRCRTRCADAALDVPHFGRAVCRGHRQPRWQHRHLSRRCRAIESLDHQPVPPPSALGRIVTSRRRRRFRRSAVFDVGGFSPRCDRRHRAHGKLKAFYDVRYEPHAVCWMTCAESARAFSAAPALGARPDAVLHKHIDVLWRWKCAACGRCSSSAGCRSVGAVLRRAHHAVDRELVDRRATRRRSPIPNLWGWRSPRSAPPALHRRLHRRRYDRDIVRFLPYAVWYPIVYWAFLR